MTICCILNVYDVVYFLYLLNTWKAHPNISLTYSDKIDLEGESDQ